eukprot:598507-Hanusia_phi.AAC.1
MARHAVDLAETAWATTQERSMVIMMQGHSARVWFCLRGNRPVSLTLLASLLGEREIDLEIKSV